jgi:hypothetical protein
MATKKNAPGFASPGAFFVSGVSPIRITSASGDTQHPLSGCPPARRSAAGHGKPRQPARICEQEPAWTPHRRKGWREVPQYSQELGSVPSVGGHSEGRPRFRGVSCLVSPRGRPIGGKTHQRVLRPAACRYSPSRVTPILTCEPALQANGYFSPSMYHIHPREQLPRLKCRSLRLQPARDWREWRACRDWGTGSRLPRFGPEMGENGPGRVLCSRGESRMDMGECEVVRG